MATGCFSMFSREGSVADSDVPASSKKKVVGTDKRRGRNLQNTMKEWAARHKQSSRHISTSAKNLAAQS
jgi:hypothetical protein